MRNPPGVRIGRIAPRTRLERLLGRWWGKQTPARQDRFATLGPLVSVLLFLAAIISAFWYLRNEEFEREQEAVKRDAEIAQQQIRLRLIENKEQLVRIAREVATRTIDREQFVAQAATFTQERPEINALTWVGTDRKPRASYTARGIPVFDFDPIAGGDPDASPDPALKPDTDTFDATRVQRQPVYSGPLTRTGGADVFQVIVPLIDRNAFTGALIAEYSIERLLRYFVPVEITNRHSIALYDEHGRSLASSVIPMPGREVRPAAIVYDLPLAPAGNGIVLRSQGFRTSIGLVSNTLFWMVVALSVLTLWTLLGTWRHMSRRMQMQAALVTETNFRRAMENSMLTGMRAMDMEARITYVNPAFCAMTGFAEGELVGHQPPFPYWPSDRREENNRLLLQELQGRSPAGGIEVKVMRKNGTVFDARMYVSPLIDPKGHQTGWVTSMTNITEGKRVRDQLSASHERFTTVLEGLEAAVSVLSVQQGELLFANRSYRLWFGADGSGHALLAGSESRPAKSPADEDDSVDNLGGLPTHELTGAGSDPREIFVEGLEKWFDVRARYLQWTDGRLAQMLIATDITARRSAEALAANQAEKAQVTSRLMTMGEMASSVAHELNQPLTAISNYCNGMMTRVESGTIKTEDLIAALAKTSRQAQRAGQIIHRIRSFVKRSEPQRQWTQARTIIDDAVELAGIELRRRNVAIQTHVAQRLPPLHVDPILIEQVVLNLLKNAAEAIDSARLPPARRSIELRVVPRHSAEEGGVIEFSVTDTGPGIKDEAIGRLYEAFFSTKTDGLGIGLSLCRSIVESHQGRIKAQNLYNGNLVEGCRFSFTLPVDLSQTEGLAPALSLPP